MSDPLRSRSITSYIIIALTLVGLAIIIWRVSEVVIIAFGSIVLAAVFRSLALPLAKVLRIPPRWSLMIVVVLLVTIAILGSWLFGNLVASQMQELQQQVRQASAKLIEWMEQTETGEMLVYSVQKLTTDSSMLTNVGMAAGAIVRFVTGFILILFLAIYFAVDPPLYREGALQLLPPSRRPYVRKALNDSGVALKKWLLAQCIAMVAVGAMVGIGLSLLGIPLAFSLGLMAGVCEFVPVVGPVLSSIPGILLAFAKGPEMAVYTTLIYVAVQQLEGNIIVPLAQQWAVRLPPVIGLIAILIFGLLFGIMGVIFATPMAVVVVTLVKHLYVADTLENHVPP